MAVEPYITVADAQAYFDDRLNVDPWESATESDQLRALKDATQRINNLRYIGQVAVDGQANEFPRLGQSSVPKEIKDATCELALRLLDDVDPNEEINSVAATSDGFANVKTSYDRDFVLAHVRNGIPSSEAWAKLVPWLIDPLSITIQRVS